MTMLEPSTDNTTRFSVQDHVLRNWSWTLLLVVAAELALHRQLALSTSSTGMDIQNTDHDAQDPRVKLESGPHETTADGSYTDSDLILDARQFAEVVVDCK